MITQLSRAVGPTAQSQHFKGVPLHSDRNESMEAFNYLLTSKQEKEEDVIKPKALGAMSWFSLLHLPLSPTLYQVHQSASA